MKRGVPIILMLGLIGGFAFADDSPGYFAQSSNWLTIAGGATTNPGAVVNLASIWVPAGSYLITARVDGSSYGPNSGAVCFLTAPIPTGPWGYQTVDTSSTTTWSVLRQTSTVILSKYINHFAGTINLSCQKGYQFTNSSLFTGTLMLVKVDHIN